MSGGIGGSPSDLTNQRPSLPFVPALSLCQKIRELHRQFPEVLWRDLSPTRILEVTELSSFQFVLVPFLVSPNSDSQVSQLTNRAYAYQLSVDRWWFCEMLTYAAQSLQAPQTYHALSGIAAAGGPVSYWCVA